MPTDPRTRVLVVARDLEIRRRLAHALEADDAPFELEEVPDAAAARERLADGGVDVALVRLQPPDGLGAVREIHAAVVDVPIVALLATGAAEASEAALGAGAVDSIGEERLEPELLRRTVRFAIERSRLQREAHRRSVVDIASGVYNARGFEQLLAHHLRLAERSNEAVVLVFVRLDLGSGTAAPDTALVRDTADVLREAVRGADVVGRLGADTFGVLLTGDASGHEGIVLTRIVEAVATRNARRGGEPTLSLSVGSATWDAAHPSSLRELITAADAGMRPSGPTAS
jgi:diguanylate cyclase (GGDEF)-like protein